MALMVCEGVCNPTIEDVDREIVRARSANFTGNGVLLDVKLLLAIRRLVHTEHLPVTQDWYRCVVCDHIRRCGGSPWSPPPRNRSLDR